MGWASTAGKSAAKYGVKYGPHAVALWRVAGPHVESAARARMDEVTARRAAFAHADSVVQGSVLRVLSGGRGVFVVWAADEPVACYPEVDRPLADLVVSADLTKRTTPEQRRERRLRARARQGGARALRR